VTSAVHARSICRLCALLCLRARNGVKIHQPLRVGRDRQETAAATEGAGDVRIQATAILLAIAWFGKKQKKIEERLMLCWQTKFRFGNLFIRNQTTA